MLDNIPVLNWRFMDEPAYRWAIFVIMMGFFLGAWGNVLRHMGAGKG